MKFYPNKEQEQSRS